eukprot:TRINITY_DN2243_c0_g1_i2.p1 TRINITY_DN2243_c0_g1~~TRINITY_DN2243_c0_g1_i2.p1  ORF type:complete len:102 (+),score=10.44 TRINITY_DN2243_c0_g1_i2:80-385(+)
MSLLVAGAVGVHTARGRIFDKPQQLEASERRVCVGGVSAGLGGGAALLGAQELHKVVQQQGPRAVRVISVNVLKIIRERESERERGGQCEQCTTQRSGYVS